MWNSIDPHPTVAGGAYLAGTLYKTGDYTPYLYKTTDYGKTWKKITRGIDALHFTRVVRADPKKAGLLYAGTEYGMYISFDDGEHWKSFQLNLPEVPITDLAIKENDLIVATQGRSFWIMDDLTPLHQLNEEVAASEYYLYKPGHSYRIRQGRSRGVNKLLVGEDHPGGVLIHFYLSDKPDSTNAVSLEILEADGDLVKRYSSAAKKKNDTLKVETGMNRFVWDMRYPDAVSFDGLILYSANTKGPVAVPGNYRVKLTVAGKSMEQDFEILKDPRVKSSIADLQAQFDFLIEVRDKLSEANQAVLDIRTIRKDLNYLKGKFKEQAEFADIIDMASELDRQMTVIENNIHETRNEARQDPLNFGIKLNNRLAYLATHESAGDFRPTDQGVAYKKEVSAQIDKELKDLKQLLTLRLNELNKIIREKGVQFIKIGGEETTE